nr:ATP synthase F0 subunit 8 [Lepidostoma hirtum]
MPQMMPLNWSLLFILTNMIFYLFLILNFYSYPTKIDLNLNSLNNNNDTQSIYNFWPIY